MDNDLSTKTVLVFDGGCYTHMAQRLAREFGRVLYYREWKQDQPQTLKLMVGDGYEEFQRVAHFNDFIDQVDLFVFTDIYHGDLQLDLERRGKRVWGSRKAEKFEYNRLLFKRTLEEVGLAVPPYKYCVGMTELRKHLEKHDDLWIKTNLRGDGETWHHKNMVLSERKLAALDLLYGPAREDVEFIAEEGIKTTTETGFDGPVVADPEGRVLTPSHGWTVYEDKNLSAIAAAVPYDELPEPVLEINEKFLPKLCAQKFRSHFGTEIKRTEDEQSFFLDATCRQSQPPGEIMMEAVPNLGEVMWHGSVGEMVPLNVVAKYGVQVMLYSSQAAGNYVPVQISSKSRPWTKLFTSCQRDGVDYIVPESVEKPKTTGDEEVGCIIGLGDTIEEAYEHLQKNCEGVEGFDTHEQMDSLAECIKRAQAGEDLGIEFGDEKIPDPAELTADA